MSYTPAPQNQQFAPKGVNFIEAIKICFKKYVDFSGRATRPEFWWFYLFIFIVTIIVSMIASSVMAGVAAVAAQSTLAAGQVATPEQATQLMAGALGSVWWAWIVILALELPLLAATVRRLRDSGKEWYWIFVTFIPAIGSFWLIYMLCQPSVGAQGNQGFGGPGGGYGAPQGYAPQAQPGYAAQPGYPAQPGYAAQPGFPGAPQAQQPAQPGYPTQPGQPRQPGQPYPPA